MVEEALLGTSALILGASALFSFAAWVRSLGRAEQSQLNGAGLTLLLATPLAWRLRHGSGRGELSAVLLMGASAWALRVGWRLIKTPSESPPSAASIRRKASRASSERLAPSRWAHSASRCRCGSALAIVNAPRAPGAGAPPCRSSQRCSSPRAWSTPGARTAHRVRVVSSR